MDPAIIYGNAELELLNMDLNNMSTQSSTTSTNTVLNAHHSHSIFSDKSDLVESPAVWKLPRTPHTARTPGPVTATPFLTVPATPSNPPT